MWVTFVLSWKFYSLSFISVDDTARKVKVEKMVRSELKKLDWKPIYLTAYNIRNKNVNFNIQEKAECESHVTYNMYSLHCMHSSFILLHGYGIFFLQKHEMQVLRGWSGFRSGINCGFSFTRTDAGFSGWCEACGASFSNIDYSSSSWEVVCQAKRSS